MRDTSTYVPYVKRQRIIKSPVGSAEALVTTGYHHIDYQQPCDDYADVLVLEKKQTILVAVADGVGSEKFARFGAAIAVQTFLTFCALELNKKGTTEDAVLQAFPIAWWQVRYKVEQVAATLKVDRHVLSTTLLVTIVTPSTRFSALLGDGGIEIDREPHCLIHPDMVRESIFDTVTYTIFNNALHTESGINADNFVVHTDGWTHCKGSREIFLFDHSSTVGSRIRDVARQHHVGVPEANEDDFGMAAIHCNSKSSDLQGLEYSLTHVNYMLTRFSGSSFGARTAVLELPDLSVSFGLIQRLSGRLAETADFFVQLLMSSLSWLATMARSKESLVRAARNECAKFSRGFSENEFSLGVVIAFEDETHVFAVGDTEAYCSRGDDTTLERLVLTGTSETLRECTVGAGMSVAVELNVTAEDMQKALVAFERGADVILDAGDELLQNDGVFLMTRACRREDLAGTYFESDWYEWTRGAFERLAMHAFFESWFASDVRLHLFKLSDDLARLCADSKALKEFVDEAIVRHPRFQRYLVKEESLALTGGGQTTDSPEEPLPPASDVSTDAEVPNAPIEPEDGQPVVKGQRKARPPIIVDEPGVPGGGGRPKGRRHGVRRGDLYYSSVREFITHAVIDGVSYPKVPVPADLENIESWQGEIIWDERGASRFYLTCDGKVMPFEFPRSAKKILWSRHKKDFL